MKKSLVSQIKHIALRASWCLLALSFLASPARSQDIQVNCAQNPTCTLTPAGGLPWASTTQPLIFIFRPIAPHATIYIFLHNLNPTSTHTQTVSVYQTPFAQSKAPSLSKNASNWLSDTVTQNNLFGIPIGSCNSIPAFNDTFSTLSGLGSCFSSTLFAAQVAIVISSGSAQVGTPDNFELAIIQEIGSPGGSGMGS
jgi:hypothetical protein